MAERVILPALPVTGIDCKGLTGKTELLSLVTARPFSLAFSLALYLAVFVISFKLKDLVFNPLLSLSAWLAMTAPVTAVVFAASMS